MIIRIGGYPITANFGAIDSVHKIPHKGVDIAMPEGTPLHAIADGIVSRINDEGARSFGKSISIKLQDGTEVIYGHLSKANVSVNQKVSAGDFIGLSGSSGNSTGPHLHLQMANGTFDPMAQAETHGWIYNLFHHPLENSIGSVVVEKTADHAADAAFSYAGQFLYRLNVDFVSILPELSVTLICILVAIGMITASMGKMLARSAAIYLGGATWIVLTKSFV